MRVFCAEYSPLCRELEVVNQLNTVEDVATLLDAYEEFIKTEPWSTVSRVMQDSEGFYYFTTSMSFNDFDIYNFIQSRYTGEDLAGINFLIARTLVGQGRGLGTLIEQAYERGEPLTADEDYEATGLLSEEDMNVISQEPAYGYLYSDRLNRDFQITSNPIIFGRSQTQSDFAISDNNKLSRKHAMFLKKGDGYYVMDIGSSNGVYLNRNRIEVNAEVLLQDGDVVLLADEAFTFNIRG